MGIEKEYLGNWKSQGVSKMCGKMAGGGLACPTVFA